MIYLFGSLTIKSLNITTQHTYNIYVYLKSTYNPMVKSYNLKGGEFHIIE